MRTERSYSQKSSFSDVLNDQNDDAFDTAMALMRLGRVYPNLADSSLQGPGAYNVLSIWPSHLPEEQHARCLVNYYLDKLSWHHNVLHHSEFLSQCEILWVTGEVVAAQWMSLYFAVLAVSVILVGGTITIDVELTST